MSKKSARELDKERLENEKKKKVATNGKKKEKRKIKKTTIQTLPYEKFVNKNTLLLHSNVRFGKLTANLYSKTYLVPDANYSSLTEKEQLEKLNSFVKMMNGFDTASSVQISIINRKIDKEEFRNSILLKDKDDEYNELRHELNDIISDKLTESQNGLQSSRYLTVTVIAQDLDIANNRFFTIEEHLASCFKELGTDIYLLDANERTKLLGNIFRPDAKFGNYTITELERQQEKMDISPDYFEFEKDYFKYNEFFCRCLYFRKLSTSIRDTIYSELLGTNREIIITENLDFVDKNDAEQMLERKLTDMNQEKINKTRRAAESSRGVYVDTMTGSKLEEDIEKAREFLDDIKNRGQNMIKAQFIIMIKAYSYEQLQNDTDVINTILRKYSIESINAPFRQEVALSSVLPLGNSNSADKDNNLQFRRTMSSESISGFTPFNCVELLHPNGVYYGINQMSKNPIIFDRNELNNPNGFIFGVPGSGKSVTTKLEIIYTMLRFDDEIIIIDPEREYTPLVELLGGEVIYISQSSASKINPLDLVPNPDPEHDKEYDPINAKLDLLLSFFSVVLNKEITPIQKTVIYESLIKTYEQCDKPTLKELHKNIEEYAKTCDDVEKESTISLAKALQLYATGGMNLFSNQSNVNINKRLVCYDIKSLSKNLNTLGLTVVMENVWGKLAENRVKGRRTRIYVDEMHLMFKNETTSYFFYELYKRARKWGGIPTGITQNIEDVLRSANARSMINTTEFVLMLSQNSADREELAKICTIPPDTMRYVTNADKGMGLMHIAKYGDIPFDYQIPKNTTIYKTVTTKFKEELEDGKTDD